MLVTCGILGTFLLLGPKFIVILCHSAKCTKRQRCYKQRRFMSGLGEVNRMNISHFFRAFTQPCGCVAGRCDQDTVAQRQLLEERTGKGRAVTRHRDPSGPGQPLLYNRPWLPSALCTQGAWDVTRYFLLLAVL